MIVDLPDSPAPNQRYQYGNQRSRVKTHTQKKDLDSSVHSLFIILDHSIDLGILL